jgi:hypothetical protein
LYHQSPNLDIDIAIYKDQYLLEVYIWLIFNAHIHRCRKSMDNYTGASLHLMESLITPNNRAKSRGSKVGKQPIRSQKSTGRPQTVRRPKHKEEAGGKPDSASVMKETLSSSHPSDSITSQGAFLYNIDRPDEFWVLVGMHLILLLVMLFL